MGILGFGKKTSSGVKKVSKKPSEKTSKKKEVTAIVTKNPSGVNLSKDYIVRPLITEKAHSQSETNNVFTFKVTNDANKSEIAKYIEVKYKVTPIKVSIINVKDKKVFSRGKIGFKSGFKKAFVYLKKGDKIEIA